MRQRLAPRSSPRACSAAPGPPTTPADPCASHSPLLDRQHTCSWPDIHSIVITHTSRSPMCITHRLYAIRSLSGPSTLLCHSTEATHVLAFVTFDPLFRTAHAAAHGRAREGRQRAVERGVERALVHPRERVPIRMLPACARPPLSTGALVGTLPVRGYHHAHMTLRMIFSTSNGTCAGVGARTLRHVMHGVGQPARRAHHRQRAVAQRDELRQPASAQHEATRSAECPARCPV